MIAVEASLLLGFFFVVLAAVCNGTLAVPQKFVRGFAWENTWGAFYLITMIVIPGVFALVFLKGAAATWYEAGLVRVLVPLVFGLLWGCGMTCFGLGVTMLGISLGYAIMMGLSVAVGSVVPLLTQHTSQIFAPSGLLALAGIAVCTAGVAVCGRAGVLRERSLSSNQAATGSSGRFARGLLICILAGVFGSSVNLAFSYGGPIIEISQTEFGNPPAVATLSVWMLVFWGGFLVTGPYCAVLLARNATWNRFAAAGAGRDLTLAAVMALLHFLILFFYGIAAYYLGPLGTSVGWAAFISCGLLIANVAGFLTAEWSDASRKSRRWLFAGLAVLVLGICILGSANAVQQEQSQPTNDEPLRQVEMR